jgi:hypothetical protein
METVGGRALITEAFQGNGIQFNDSRLAEPANLRIDSRIPWWNSQALGMSLYNKKGVGHVTFSASLLYGLCDIERATCSRRERGDEEGKCRERGFRHPKLEIERERGRGRKRERESARARVY